MNVLIIPEDFRYDQYILRPLFQRLFRSLDRRATVTVLTDPLLGGVDEALKSERLAEVVEQYDGMTDALAKQRGVADDPGRGRKTLGEEASRNIGAIRQKCRQKCREDFDRLAGRIRVAA